MEMFITSIQVGQMSMETSNTYRRDVRLWSHHFTNFLCVMRTATGSSQWEPPVWWDEVDPASGAVYYR